MNIRKGDEVIVLSGADKGKKGIVQKVYPKTNKVVVEGISVHKKHQKPTQATPEGSIVEVYTPIDASKVTLIDPKTKKATRVHMGTDKNGKKIRLAASGQAIDR